MAFDATKIQPTRETGVFQHFIYRTTGDSLKTITSGTASTYFNPYAAQMDAGDTLSVEGSDAQGMFKVASKSTAGAITVQPIGDIANIVSGATSANLAPYGAFHSTTASTTTYTIDMPIWGVGETKRIVHTGASTAVTVVTASTSAGALNSTGVQILFNAANQAAILMAPSTSQWLLAAHGVHSGTAIVGPIVT